MKTDISLSGILRVVVLGIVLGCGGDDSANLDLGSAPVTSSAETANPKDNKPAGKPWDAALGTATVAGVVKFEGEAPQRRPIDLIVKKECAVLHKEPLLEESLILNEDGALQNTFVWVKKGLEVWKFSTPTEVVVLDQKGCAFHPHVLGVQTNQKILIRNSDPFAHNVHAFPSRNTGFNFSQIKAGTEDIKSFPRQDVMVQMKCDIHSWMNNQIGVVDHPYFAVTAEDGSFELPNLPSGEYTIEAVHEVLGTQETTIVVADKERKTVEFSFKDE